MHVVISPATGEQLPECARIIAQALGDDPIVTAMFPAAARHPQAMIDAYGAILRITARSGVVDVARAQEAGAVSGPIVGVAAWECPGHRAWSWAQLREIPILMRAVGLRHLPGVGRQMTHYARCHPRAPHWYLSDIAVRPQGRGLGVGSALLRHRLTAIDRDRQPAYLEATTPDSRRLYERYGFRPVAMIPVTPTLTAVGMLRPAASR